MVRFHWTIQKGDFLVSTLKIIGFVLARTDDQRLSLQVKYYVKAKLYNEAANIAFQRKDTEALHYIQSRCASQRDTVDKINRFVGFLLESFFVSPFQL